MTLDLFGHIDLTTLILSGLNIVIFCVDSMIGLLSDITIGG